MLLDLLQALCVLLAIAFVGRVVLSLLPVGALGAHGARELPATWAASHLLGLGVFAAHLRVVGALHLGPGGWSGWTLVVPWVAVAVLRVAFQPGALVPRHEPRNERVPWSVFVLYAAAMVLVTTPWWLDQELREAVQLDWHRQLDPETAIPGLLAWTFGAGDAPRFVALLGAASTSALVVLVVYGLTIARRSPFARGLAVLWLAWLVFLARGLVAQDPGALVVLAFGAGAAASVAWFRRGDRRALALATLAFVAASSFATRVAPCALACLVVLVAASPRASMRFAAAWCGLATVLVVLCAEAPSGGWVTPDPELPRAAMLTALLVPALSLAASAFALRVLVLRRPDPRERIDPTTRESLAVGAMLVFGALAALAREPGDWNRLAEGMPHLPAALLPFLGLVPLLVGLVGAPDERTLPPA